MWQVMKQKQEGTDVALTNVSKKKKSIYTLADFFSIRGVGSVAFFFHLGSGDPAGFFFLLHNITTIHDREHATCYDIKEQSRHFLFLFLFFSF